MEDEITKATYISDRGTEVLVLRVRDKDGIRAAFIRPVWEDITDDAESVLPPTM